MTVPIRQMQRCSATRPERLGHGVLEEVCHDANRLAGGRRHLGLGPVAARRHEAVRLVVEALVHALGAGGQVDRGRGSEARVVAREVRGERGGMQGVGTLVSVELCEIRAQPSR